MPILVVNFHAITQTLTVSIYDSLTNDLILFDTYSFKDGKKIHGHTRFRDDSWHWARKNIQALQYFGPRERIFYLFCALIRGLHEELDMIEYDSREAFDWLIEQPDFSFHLSWDDLLGGLRTVEADLGLDDGVTQIQSEWGIYATQVDSLGSTALTASSPFAMTPSIRLQ